MQFALAADSSLASVVAQGENDNVSVQIFAVGELDALADGQDHGHVICAPLPLGSQARIQVAGSIHIDQSFINVSADQSGGNVVAGGIGIEAGSIHVHGNTQVGLCGICGSSLSGLCLSLFAGAGEFDGEPVFIAESTGYARKAAEEEFILAMPEDHDTPPIMELYNYMVKNYPVDRSRVYLTGYSAGSDRSARAALRHPELFAGMLIGAGVPFNLIDDPQEIENAVKYKIPFIAVGCLSDKGNHTPFYSSNSLDNPVPDFIAKLLSAEGKMMWINRFFRINHIPYYSIEENKEYVLSQGTPAEKRIGMRAQRSKTWEWAGQLHYCLDYTDAEGIDSVRYVFVDGMPHFEPVDMMDIAWPFLKRFSRNMEDGSLVCDQPEYDRE